MNLHVVENPPYIQSHGSHDSGVGWGRLREFRDAPGSSRFNTHGERIDWTHSMRTRHTCTSHGAGLPCMRIGRQRL